MAHGVVALRRHQRSVVTRPEETPSAVLTHLALAITRYVRQLRKDDIPVPPMIDELAAFLTLYVRTRQAVTGVDGDYGTPHDVPVVRRLLITKAEAAEQLGISVRTVERLIAAGRLPLAGRSAKSFAQVKGGVTRCIPRWPAVSSDNAAGQRGGA